MRRLLAGLRTALVGIALTAGAGAIFLAPSVGDAGEETWHRSDTGSCVPEGCDRGSQICCSPDED